MNQPISSATNPRREFLRGAGACSLAMLGMGAGPAHSADESLDELYAKARAEGALSYYAGGPLATHRRTADAFMKAFPGINVSLQTGLSNDLTIKIDSQIKARTMDCDVAMLQTLQDFERWKRAEQLMVYRPAGSDTIASGFKDPDGTSIGVAVYAVGYAHNPDLLSRADAPKSGPDFLKPGLAGKVISTYPHDDDITLYLYYTLVQKHGWDFMRDFMANKPRFIRGHLGVAREIAEGRASTSFDATVTTSLSEKRRGGKIESYFSEIDPVPIWANSAAIFKNAPHPNTARLFISWTMAQQEQAKLPAGMWSTRSDVPPPQSMRPITDFKLANTYREFIIDEPKVVDLRKRFASIIGPVQGEPVIV